MATDRPSDAQRPHSQPDGASEPIEAPENQALSGNRTAETEEQSPPIRSPAGTGCETRVIAMTNQKGGVGKTTTTVNLGAALARRGRRVCIVDLDPQAHASLHLGIDTDAMPHTIYDLLTDESIDPASALVRAQDNLWLIGSETDLAAVEGELASAPNRHARLTRVIESVRERVDYVLIDCPPSLGLLTINGLVAAGDVLIPMQAQFLALQGVGKLGP